jgi:hypothetical protein
MYIHGDEHEIKFGGVNENNIASPFCIGEIVVSDTIFGVRTTVTMNICLLGRDTPILRCADGSGITGLSETSIQVFVPDYAASHQVFVYLVQEHAVRKRLNR